MRSIALKLFVAAVVLGRPAHFSLGWRETRQLCGRPERHIGLRRLVGGLHGATIPRGALEADHGRRYCGGWTVGLRRDPAWLPPPVTASQYCSHTAPKGLPFLGPPNLAASIAATKDAAAANHIDPTKSLADAKVFLFSGTKDSLVPQSVMNELDQYYLTFVPLGECVTSTTCPRSMRWSPMDMAKLAAIWSAIHQQLWLRHSW